MDTRRSAGTHRRDGHWIPWLCYRGRIGTSALLLLAACTSGGESPTNSDPDPEPAPTATLSGIVQEGGRVVQSAIAGATVRAGGRTATTDADGRFTLQEVPTGSTALDVEADGFDSFSLVFTVVEGTHEYDVVLFRSLSIHAQDAFTLGLPPETSDFRGVVYFLPGSGGETRALVRGEEDAPTPTDLRARFLVLAEVHGLALLGSDALLNNTGTYDEISTTLADLASASGHPELSEAPLLLLGYSAGGCVAHGFTRARPDRVLGFLTMKGGCHIQGDSDRAKAVPGYLFIGETDTQSRIDNITEVFEWNRADGALWALAIEPGVGHSVVVDNALLADWADAVLEMRLPAPGGPATLQTIDEDTGWLGDRNSFAIASFDCYSGDKSTASWLPVESLARDWQAFVSEGSVTTVISC